MARRFFIVFEVDRQSVYIRNDNYSGGPHPLLQAFPQAFPVSHIYLKRSIWNSESLDITVHRPRNMD
jgi:hypothetical protein